MVILTVEMEVTRMQNYAVMQKNMHICLKQLRQYHHQVIYQIEILARYE